jgi:hypothetical protein
MQVTKRGQIRRGERFESAWVKLGGAIVKRTLELQRYHSTMIFSLFLRKNE